MQFLITLLLFGLSSQHAIASDGGLRRLEKEFRKNPSSDVFCGAYLRGLFRSGQFGLGLLTEIWPHQTPEIGSLERARLAMDGRSLVIPRSERLSRVDLTSGEIKQVGTGCAGETYSLLDVARNDLVLLGRYVTSVVDFPQALVEGLKVLNVRTGAEIARYSLATPENPTPYVFMGFTDYKAFALSPAGTYAAAVLWRNARPVQIKIFKINPESRTFDEQWSFHPTRVSQGVAGAQQITDLFVNDSGDTVHYASCTANGNVYVRRKNGISDEPHWVISSVATIFDFVRPLDDFSDVLVRGTRQVIDGVHREIAYPFRVNDSARSVVSATPSGHDRILWLGEDFHLRLFKKDGKLIFEGQPLIREAKKLDAQPGSTRLIDLVVNPEGRVVVFIGFEQGRYQNYALLISDFVVK